MKKIFAFVCCAFCFFPLFAQNSVKDHQGFSVGIHGEGIFPFGEYTDYETAGTGGGLSVEYTLPPLSQRLSLGFSLRSTYRYYFLKDDIPLSSLNDIDTTAGCFLRLPFALGKLNMAFQPELGYGVLMHLAGSKSGVDMDALYVNQLAAFSPSLRFLLPGNDSSDGNFEIELSPVYSAVFEQDNIQHSLGARIGFIWDISDFCRNKK